VIYTLDQNQLPAFEKDIDHKGIIAGVEDAYDRSMKHGQSIYTKICFNCHGDPLQEGSIPTAFKFWKDTFKTGSDPYTLYQILTRGYKTMPPQYQLTPLEKYEIIQFIREEYVNTTNKSQYFKIDSQYLDRLPKGSNKGPAPAERKPWAEMDYGNFLINTYELAGKDAKPREISSGIAPLADENLVDANFAYKGIAVRLDTGQGGIAAGHAWMIFDHDVMRVAGAWTGDGFIDWQGILFNGSHNISPRTIGDLHFENPIGPGWADPITGSFEDHRFMAIDKRRFGPLPRSWAQYKGLYQYDGKTIISYTVDHASVLELFGLEATDHIPVFTRTLNISSALHPLKLRVAPDTVSVSLIGDHATLVKSSGNWILEIPKGTSAAVKLLISKASQDDLNRLANNSSKVPDLNMFTKGGPSRFPEFLTSSVAADKNDMPFQVDVLNLPFNSIWKNQFRLSGIDFLADKNKGIICSTDGDVWLVEGFLDPKGKLTWKRIAAGLFQPLGVKVVNDEIYITCRDQLVKLHDLNGDGEIDFFQSFNSDHQVTNHFHEFAMGLQTDAEGNFYYAKSARHARRALVPQHGTLLKVSKDGSKSEIIATGFRAANGVCINPDGSFIVTDQEGHWNPMNRINWVTKGGFYGNMFSYNPPPDSSDEGMIPPLAWVEKHIDQSPSELLWVNSNTWGPLNGSLLNFSYGYGKVFIVPFEKIGSVRQGGVFELPMPRFQTGIMRGRFNDGDGQLYVCGLSAWGSSQSNLGGLYRIRYNGQKAIIPIGIKAKQHGVEINFSHPLEVTDAEKLSSYTVQTWDLLRSRKYGSAHHNEKVLKVTEAKLSDDKRTIFLQIPDIKPTWVMEISFEYTHSNGEKTKGLIQNTIYQLGN
jgi:glucose/arabinose dehydrogenase/cytochrome c5